MKCLLSIGLVACLFLGTLRVTADAGQQAERRERLTFNQAYEACLVVMALSRHGGDYGQPRLEMLCRSSAARQSGAEPPAITPYDRSHQACLMRYAMAGAPPNIDIATTCATRAAAETGTGAPAGAYVIFAQPGTSLPTPQGAVSYYDAYEACLIHMAVTGNGRSLGYRLEIVCDGMAREQSGGPPLQAPTPFQTAFKDCLMLFARHGADGHDVVKECTRAASLPVADEPRGPRTPPPRGRDH